MPLVSVEHLLRSAVLHHQAGRLVEAEPLYRQALAAQPGNAHAAHYLGLLLHQKGEAAEALALLRRAMRLSPMDSRYAGNTAQVLLALGRADEAAEMYRRTLVIRPDNADAQNQLGLAYAMLRQFDKAAACYRKAVEIKPDHAAAWNSLGLRLRDENKLDEAMECYQRALAADPRNADAHNNVGRLLHDSGKLDEAMAAYQRALELKPSYAQVHSNLAAAFKDMGDLDGALASDRQALALQAEVRIGSNLIYDMLFHPDVSSEERRAELGRWRRMFAEPVRGTAREFENERIAERRLRIGYVSPDFKSHPIGRFMLPLLEHHNHERFEIYCYSDVRHGDEITRASKAAADVWRDTGDLSDEQLADLIRRDRIDILVDLTMHMEGSRLLVFARKPAPVQVTYLAYCGTTGLDTIDYRLTDGYLDPPSTSSGQAPSTASTGSGQAPSTPSAGSGQAGSGEVPGEDESEYAEKSVRLRSYWCYAPPAGAPDVGPLPVERAGHVTFGCLNNYCKITEGTWAAWLEVLRNVPKSRLLIHAREGSHRERARGRLAASGIDPGRLEFAGALPTLEYLAQYGRIDVALDPFPYPGGTTTCDALWMGVPVVTLAGKTAISRGGLSIMGTLGMNEWVARDAEEYVEIASKRAADVEGLKALRAGLRERMGGSVLMDAAGFAEDVEKAFVGMWQEWCYLR